MSIKRITLNFDMNDQNSMILYGILNQLKRGHRMEVLSDNILSILSEHHLLDKYGYAPEPLARALIMFSDNYRSCECLKYPASIPASETQLIKNSLSHTKHMVSSGERSEKQPGTSSIDSVRMNQPVKPEASYDTKDGTEDVLTEPQNCHDHLSPQQWILAMNNEALDYYATCVPSAQFKEYKEALRMIGDEDDIYEELITEPGLILNHLAPAPSNEISFEEWLVKRLNAKGIYRE